MTETWDPMIVFILKQKLGPELRSKWEEERKGSHECATLKEFLRFLDTWRKIVANTPSKNIIKPNPNEFKPRPVKSFVQREDEQLFDVHPLSSTSQHEQTIESNSNDVDAFLMMHSRNEICE